MEEKHSQKGIGRIFLVIYALFLPLLAVAQSGDGTVDELVRMGFENVTWAENDSERVYLLENSAYRLSGVGIGKALDEIQKRGLPQDGKVCRLIVLDNNVPKISLCCDTGLLEGKEVSRNDWNVSYDLGDGWDLVKGKESVRAEGRMTDQRRVMHFQVSRKKPQAKEYWCPLETVKKARECILP